MTVGKPLKVSGFLRMSPVQKAERYFIIELCLGGTLETSLAVKNRRQ